jgi:hypothetical protein
MAMAVTVTELYQCTCNVCEHYWETVKEPLRCAKCKTPYWNKERKLKVRKEGEYAASKHGV